VEQGGNIGGYPPSDTRGQGGWNRESYQLPNEGESQAKYAAETDREESEAKRPSLLERIRRWVAAQI
jgi:hypothetical protein